MPSTILDFDMIRLYLGSYPTRQVSNEKSHFHINGCAGAHDCTRRRPDDGSAEGEDRGCGEGNADSATYARRPARPSGSMDQQQRYTLAAPQGARRERILYASGIGGASKA